MSILAEIAKENKWLKLGQCISLVSEVYPLGPVDKDVTVSVFDYGRRISVVIQFSSKRDMEKLVRYLEQSDISIYGVTHSNRVNLDYLQKSRHNIDYDLRLVIDFIKELGYE
jgi:hypothetical protein